MTTAMLLLLLVQVNLSLTSEGLSDNLMDRKMARGESFSSLQQFCSVTVSFKFYVFVPSLPMPIVKWMLIPLLA